MVCMLGIVRGTWCGVCWEISMGSGVVCMLGIRRWGGDLVWCSYGILGGAQWAQNSVHQ